MRKIVDVPKQVLKVMSCDKCKRDLTDEQERQEALVIVETGGYSSVFGDGSSIDLDLCQHCVKELLGEWIAINQITDVCENKNCSCPDDNYCGCHLKGEER